MKTPLILLCLVCAPLAGAQARYKVVDLYPDLQNNALRAIGVNNRGEVLVTHENNFESYLWRSPGDYTLLKDGSEGVNARGLNNQGQVTGNVVRQGRVETFLYSAQSGLQSLGPALGYTHNDGKSVNDKGEVLSEAVKAGARHPVVWRPGSGWEDLSGPPPLDRAAPQAINDLGQFTGSYRAPDNLFHAVLYTPGSGIQDLGMPEGMNSVVGMKINNLGVIGGSMNRLADTAEVGFLRDPDGTLTQLLDPAQHFNNSNVQGLTDDGTAVGYMNRPSQFGGLGGYVYNRAYGMRNIDDLKDEASSAFQIGMCHGISQNGMIVADATLNGVFRQVLLVPVIPEPPAWLSLVGALGAGLFLKRTRTATDQR